jgi:uncharacterized protein (TIGR00369 family)
MAAGGVHGGGRREEFLACGSQARSNEAGKKLGLAVRTTETVDRSVRDANCVPVLNLPQGAGTTTLESKTNFIAGAPLGSRLTGEATPVHRGRRTQVWTTRITTGEGRLVAVVTQTQMVLEEKT